ncbi:MAG TPA: transcriptional regulator [Kiloniellaceae bacterium]|nr:transcriptional regulator [Kiloniellaceae bacterium]
MYEIPRDRHTARPNVFDQTCPARFLLGRIAGKWSLLVIDALHDGPIRNGALMRRIEGISQKMLTQTLRELEDLKLLSRQDRKTVPPHVEYELTPLGRELQTMVCALDRWVEQNMFELIDGSETIPLTQR